LRKIQSFTKTRLQAFAYAISGWSYVIRSQRNAWIHAVFSLAVLVVSLWLKLSAEKIAIIILTIAMVWTAEFLNTALEAVVDLASPQKHPLAKVGKDVGAAAVLIAALASVLVGLLLLGPPLLDKLRLK
jgi:diacylglycerol kinase (ATP)